MPSIDHQKKTWGEHPWLGRGEGWSRVWGGSAYQWWGSLYPRLREFLPTQSVLEIAVGYGRWTRYLLHVCDRLIGVDLVEKCVDNCRERFAEFPQATFHQNDGTSLEMVPDQSIDLAFSFDSLVHVDRDVIRAYLQQLPSKLTADGVGFIHHSNLGAYVDPDTGKVPFDNPGVGSIHHSNLAAYVDPDTGKVPFDNPNVRDPTVSAAVFAELCTEAGLLCIGQELVNWEVHHMNDCFSLVTLPGSRFERPNAVVENPRFMDEATALGDIAAQYGPASFPGIGRQRAPDVEPATLARRRSLGQ